MVHSHLNGCMLGIQTFVTGLLTRSHKSKNMLKLMYDNISRF
jgi:hypothetical protein